MKEEVSEKEEKWKVTQIKLGTIFIVSMLALAGLGISYAGFTDTLTVYGTVDTATVEIDWIGWYSGTWVYKIYDFETTPAAPPGTPFEYDLDAEILIYKGYTLQEPIEQQVLGWATANGGIAELEAYSYAENFDGTEYDINMEYSDLFPCIDFCADFIFHYGGSIPAKINVAEIFSIDGDLYPDENGINFLDWLWAYNELYPGYGAWVQAYRMYGFDASGAPTTDPALIAEWQQGEAVDIGYQLHNCYFVKVILCIHLPQDVDPQLQGLTGHFTGNIEVIQWNDQCNDQFEDKTVTFPQPPERVQITFTNPYPGVSYWKEHLETVNGGPWSYPIAAGNDLVGWCCDQTNTIPNNNPTYWCYLWNTYDTNPSMPYQNINWPKVNWIINNKAPYEAMPGYTYMDVQEAIWKFINGGHDPSTTIGQQIVADAIAWENANGPFTPQTGQWIAILVEIDPVAHGAHQYTFIEVDP